MNELKLSELEKVGRNLDSMSIASSLGQSVTDLAFRIRAVETALLNAFQNGKIAGTIHTCIGQELSPSIISRHLDEADFITSNHRCHGHFIAKTDDWQGLVLEILGSRDGVCKGIGSSQHLFADGFLSNGPQGSLLPVGTGISSWMKSNGSKGIVISFIGEGTLGEGISYESMNLAAVTKSPQLFVCENNFYSQSTKQSDSVSDNILSKPASFGIKVFSCNIWDPEDMKQVVEESINFVREKKMPAFLLIQCYRLMAHSKGDDNREQEEVATFSELDPLSILIKESPTHQARYQEISEEVSQFIFENHDLKSLDFSEYAFNNLPIRNLGMVDGDINSKIRTVEAIRNTIETVVGNGGFLIGEDICDPYGGAFKATRGISTKFPDHVMNSPISEAGLVGFAIGRALKGQPTFAEIMFGDFITYAFDQIVNNASKFFHVYGITAGLPLIIRVPNGGHRGYGPTHSQSLEKHFVGIDNVLVLALTSLVDPRKQFNAALELRVPTIAIENKMGYSRMLFQNKDSLIVKTEIGGLGLLVIKSEDVAPDITVITYGELARDMADELLSIEDQLNVKIEIVCLMQLHPLPSRILLGRKFGKVTIVAEEGSADFGVGAEIGALLLENSIDIGIFRRISAEPFPIASNRNLEESLLATVSKIKEVILKEFKYEN